MEITLRVDIMPRHIRAAGVILAGVFVFVVCGSNSLPFRSQNALHIVGPFVAPLTELAQFIAIGPENSVPQRHRASGMAAYVAFFAVATAACSRYYAAPYVTAVLQGLHAALRGEAPSPDITQQLGAQQIEELICFLPTAFMAASLGVFTLALGLDLIGPWTALRTFHVVSGIVFLVSPAVKYPVPTRPPWPLPTHPTTLSHPNPNPTPPHPCPTLAPAHPRPRPIPPPPPPHLTPPHPRTFARGRKRPGKAKTPRTLFWA